MNELAEYFLDGEAFQRSRQLLWLGLTASIQLVLAAFAVALLIGLGLYATRRSRFALVRGATVWVVDICRACPPLVALVVVYYLVPPINGYSLSKFLAATLTFGLIQGCYISEIYRGGFDSVDRGQREAAASLGLRPARIGLDVIAPQALRVMIPPLTNQFTQLVRDVSLAFFIGYAELISRARQAVTLTSSPTPYTAVALTYILLLVPLQVLSSALERRRGLERK